VLARNIELKARDRNPKRSLRICETLGAEDLGVLLQRDTYFDVPNGRLKLREEDGSAPCLIVYVREDLAGQRESRYQIVEVASPPGDLRAALGSTIGTKAVINKRRRLFVWEGVRIHLDDVDGLGRFLEFEAVIQGDQVVASQALVARLRGRFGVLDADLLSESYCDLPQQPTSKIGSWRSILSEWRRRLGRHSQTQG